MIIISAVDDRMGMMFNGRRQSSDTCVAERIVEITSGRKLFINEYSKILFEKYDNTGNMIEITKNDFADAGQQDFCFVENISPDRFLDKIDGIILFKWNRKYPGDLFFNIPLSDFKMIEVLDIKGSSHERITMEKYVK